MNKLTLKILFVFLLFNNSEIFSQITYKQQWIPFFKAKEGKIMGTYPTGTRVNNHVLKYELKYRFGFNYAVIELNQDGTWAEYAGFPKSNWMVHIWATHSDYGYINNHYFYLNRIPLFGNVWAYYVDEPGVHDLTPENLQAVKDYIELNNYTAKLGQGMQ